MPPIIPTKRYSPSGSPFEEGADSGGNIYVNQVTFPNILFPAPGEETLESTAYIWPFPVIAFVPIPFSQYPSIEGYDVFANPTRDEEAVEPAWEVLGGCFSHVRILEYNVLSDTLPLQTPADPLSATVAPPGTNGVLVRLGMGLLKPIAIDPILLGPLIFDLVFIKQAEPTLHSSVDGLI